LRYNGIGFYMPAPLLAVQYLEHSPGLPSLDKSVLVARLRAAAGVLPFTHLLIGWHLSQSVLEACRQEAERLGLRFLLWQPLLTVGNGHAPITGGQVQGLTGLVVPGYQGQPEFTFLCPNHPAVQEAILTHLEALARAGIYQGFFLDRVRFPSPSHDPLNDLACFCEHCRRKAAEEGLDLPEIRKTLLQQARQAKGRLSLVTALLTGQAGSADPLQSLAISQFISFRQKCISDLLALLIKPLRAAHLEVGLDCFSPSLARMVGQDITSLGQYVDWVKLMTYIHTHAPAGLPYELAGLLHFLTSTTRLRESQALELISQCTGLPMPATLQGLTAQGLHPALIGLELQHGLQATSAPILAGLELVDLPGIVSLNPGQIQADLASIRHQAPHGLAISWDLLHIPLDRLELVAQVYFGRS
jgi:hypothetical protein